MWPFRRREPTFPPYEPTPRPPRVGGLGDLAEYLGDNLKRMQDLEARRPTATPSDLPAIDEEMNRICQDMADGVGIPVDERSMSTRLRRMRDLTLEELRAVRDRARQ